MTIELPAAADIEGAIAVWSAEDPRLEMLLLRYRAPARALRHYGLILWEGGDPRAAAQALTGATALQPTDFRLWSDLSGALNAAGQLHQAATCMEEALRHDRTRAENWMRLGSIRSTLGDASGAEAALQTALTHDPELAEAHLSLGLILFGEKRFNEAARHLRIATETGSDVAPALRACYAQALGYIGDFAGAAAAFAPACISEPDNAVVAMKHAQACFVADLASNRSVGEAVAACRARPHVTAKIFETISRQAFHLLSAFDHRGAALRLGEARLAARPGDPECTYLLAVLRGEAIRRSPDRYIASFFDQFAEEFDHQLVDVLGYDAFRQLATLAERYMTKSTRMLDLGCGTGLAGPLLAAPGRTLTGVDLSPGMLRKACERACYDELVEGEAVAYLADHRNAFDLIFAADVLIYVGDLGELMARAAEALAPGGVFALTIETADEDLALLPSGRFAHGLAHVQRLATDSAFDVLEAETIPIRYETRGFVTGTLIVLRKASVA